MCTVEQVKKDHLAIIILRRIVFKSSISIFTTKWISITKTSKLVSKETFVKLQRLGNPKI